ncbi:MAG: leucine-rich repeat domain-containing protein [Eubacterium sp.]|nr:leucine-rich repeat domain-containing protein [Eubacterium sp.]
MKEFEYEIIAGEVKITSWLGDAQTLVIPSQIDGLPVTVIGENVFDEYGVWAEELILPDTVKKIEHPAALGNTRLHIDASNQVYHTDGYALYEQLPEGKTLSSVYMADERESYTIEEGTVQIGEDAFSGQPFIREVTFPDSVKYIKEAAFFLCEQLRYVTLSERLEEIEAEAFSRSPYLESLHLPASLRVLSEQALTNTYDWDRKKPGLRRITVSGENPYFYADDKGLYERLEKGGIKLIKYLGGERVVTLPEEVRMIGASAFRRSGIAELTLPLAVREIHEDAFLECDLEKVMLEADGTALYIPQTPHTLGEEVIKGFYKTDAGQLYPYSRYERVVQKLKLCLEKVRMICCCLQNPRLQSRERNTADSWKTYLKENLEKAVSLLAEAEDTENLNVLITYDVFDRQNIDVAIEVCNRMKKSTQLGVLMDYKNRAFGAEPFDFSL